LDVWQWDKNSAFETAAYGGVELPGDICCAEDEDPTWIVADALQRSATEHRSRIWKSGGGDICAGLGHSFGLGIRFLLSLMLRFHLHLLARKSHQLHQ